MNNNGNIESGDSVKHCEDIRDLLLDYLSHELGRGRSDLIREHLRKCPECQRAAAELRSTLDLLHTVSETDNTGPGCLSDRRRARVLIACMHPVLDWIYLHHVLVSIAVALVTIAVAVGILVRTRIWRDPPEPGPTVTIGQRNEGEAGHAQGTPLRHPANSPTRGRPSP